MADDLLALTPERAPGHLIDLSEDARAAVLLDEHGRLAGSSEEDSERALEFAELTRELVGEAGAAARDGRPIEQVEVRVERGLVYVVTQGRWTLGAVARRAALSSLMFLDMRAVLSELDPS